MAGTIIDSASHEHLPFHEITLDTDGTYYLDVDFDGINEKIIADEYSNITVLKENMHGEEVDVSKEIPLHRYSHQGYKA